MHILIAPVIFTLLGAPAQSLSQSAEWAAGMGEAILESDMTRDEAVARALNEAIKDATIKVTGVNILNIISIMNSSDDPATRASEFTKATAGGKVIRQKEPDISWETVTIDNVKYPKVTVRVEVLVAKNVKTDPSFKIAAKLNQSNYKTGDELKITLRTTRDAYITILDFSEDGAIYALAPNLKMDSFFIQGNRDCPFPSDELKKQGVVLELEPLEGKSQSSELITIIATKKEYPLLGLFNIDPAYPIQYVGNLEKLVEWKYAIPPDEIVETTLQFTIFR